MKKTKLHNGSKIFCLSSLEAQMLSKHIDGYLDGFINIKDGDVVVDVGANIGMLGFTLSEKFEKIEILSFEPIEEIYSILDANSKLSGNNKFKVYNIGLSDFNRKENFTYYPFMPSLSNSNPKIWENKKDLVKAVKGSLKEAPSNWWWSKMIPPFLYPLIVRMLTRNKKIVSCNLKTLSTVIDEYEVEKIDLLEIDCEGNELKVINGIDEKHWTIIKQLVIEVHDIDNRLNYIKNLLKSRGYNLKIEQEPSLKDINLFNVFAAQ